MLAFRLLPLDKAVQGPYFSPMLRVWIVIFSVMSFAAASYAASVHEAGMIVLEDSDAGMQHMEHASSSKASCAEDKACTTEAGLCDLVCTGGGVLLQLDRGVSRAITLQEKYLRHPDAALVAAAPDVNDRPPISRLL